MAIDDSYWEDIYLTTPPKALPWNAGRADPDLVRLVKDGRIPVGQALDLGTGPGHDAVFLIHQGFNVIAIDISPSAVKLARENASSEGLFGYFQLADIRRIPVEDNFVDFVNDRGCFHILKPEDQPKAISEIHRVLRRRGLFLLRVFSEKEPANGGRLERASPPAGPHPFTKTELENLFTPKFHILDFWEGIFEGPAKPHSYSMLLEKK